MDYIAPLNTTPSVGDPRPAYFDGDEQTGQDGSYPSGKAMENPMREILAAIEGAGLTPSNNDLTQLLQAIQILAAGAGADAAVFAYNPVFPEITVNGGLMSVSVSNGQVVVNSGQTFIHRGGKLYNTSAFSAPDRTFATVASKIYHLRWRYNGGAPLLALIDVANGTYNPGSKAETHADFDTTYDDMLIAKIATDAANNPTATALLNRAQMSATGEAVFGPSEFQGGTAPSAVTATEGNSKKTTAINFSRLPVVAMTGFSDITVQDGAAGGAELNIVVRAPSRYAVEMIYQRQKVPGGAFVAFSARA